MEWGRRELVVEFIDLFLRSFQSFRSISLMSWRKLSEDLIMVNQSLFCSIR